jgi:indolepyruvate ferredoxin oxidoreductase
MGIDPRFLTESGREVFIGNELLVKGCLETEGGVHLMTGYPGSPVAGFFDTIGDIAPLLKEKGIRAFQANNEALGSAAINGSQMLPTRAIAAMKSVGVHVAADALALGNLAGAHPEGGAVIIMGDDPWCESTQVPADSRFICEHLRMPVVEPGTPQETKDWINASFKLSQAAGLYIGYIVTTTQADGGGTVECRKNQFPRLSTKQRVELETANIDLGRVLLPPRTWQQELKIPERFAKTMEAARQLGINRIIPASQNSITGVQPAREALGFGEHTLPGTAHKLKATITPAPLGFIVAGNAAPYVDHVLADIGLLGYFPILKMGMSYPTDVELVREFSHHCTQMIVVEERRSFLEKNIRDGFFKSFPTEEAAALSARLFGKTFPDARPGIPEGRGLNPSLLAQILIPLIKTTQEIPENLRNGRLSSELEILRKASKPKLEVITEKIVPRTPTFCPGCPHRDSSAALLELRENFKDSEYMRRVHQMAPVDLVAHGDTGCYTMLMFAPTEQLMHNYSGMGLGAGTGSGIDPFITNKQIVFMGDGTFFHSGQIAISNAVKANQDITFIILENKTTAMTGHQEHAGTELDVMGNRSYIQDIEQIVRSMAGTCPMTVEKLSPADRDHYKKVLERTILQKGVKVIIADKECGIVYHRRKSKEERKIAREHGGFMPHKTHMNITPEVCEGCLECTKATACPGLAAIDTDYGRKIDTDLTWCVNDGACERVRMGNEYGTNVKPCPSFEQITIYKNRRKRYSLPKMDLDKLPEPTLVHDMGKLGAAWRVHMAGVGGMGIGIVGAILVRAGHKQGYRVIFSDKKGLAIRNGGVYSQIAWISDQSANGASRDTGVSPVPVAQENGNSQHLTVLNRSHGRDARVTDVVYPTTGTIPYGRADLLLGIDILEAARAIDPREQFRVASPNRTAAVLNTHKQSTVYTLLGKHDFDPDKLQAEVFQHVRTEHSYAKNLSELCEQRLGSKQFVNIMMLGVAYQLGLIPVSASCIGWAIRDTIRRDQRKNIKAFNIGRKLALEPRALPKKPEPLTWQQLLTNKTRIIRKSSWRGQAMSEQFDKLVNGAMSVMPALSEESKYDLALRIYDLMQYQDGAYAKRYVDLVRKVYNRDSAAHEYAATREAIWGIAKVMLIKDEPYVAYLLTRYEKKQRDIAKYAVDISNGDRVVYRHHTKPEFNILGRRIRMNITTTDWMLQIVRRMKWWRGLPGWHTRETAFRDWYIGLLDRIDLSNAPAYQKALTVLKCVQDVSGYREVRYPKMDRARESVESLLSAREVVEVSVATESTRSLQTTEA